MSKLKKPRKNYYKLKKLNKKPTWLAKNKKFNNRFVTKLVENLSQYIANDETLSMQRLSEVVILYQDTKQKKLLNVVYSNIFGWILMYLLNVKRKYNLPQKKFEEFFGDAYMVLERCCENYKPSTNNTFLSYYRMCLYWIIEHTILKHKNPLDIYSLSYIDNIQLNNNTKTVNLQLHKEFESRIENKLVLNTIFNYVVDNFDQNELIFFMKYLEKTGISQTVFLTYINKNKRSYVESLFKKRLKTKEDLSDVIFEKLNNVFGIDINVA